MSVRVCVSESEREIGRGSPYTRRDTRRHTRINNRIGERDKRTHTKKVGHEKTPTKSVDLHKRFMGSRFILTTVVVDVVVACSWLFFLIILIVLLVVVSVYGMMHDGEQCIHTRKKNMNYRCVRENFWCDEFQHFFSLFNSSEEVHKKTHTNNYY